MTPQDTTRLTVDVESASAGETDGSDGIGGRASWQNKSKRVVFWGIALGAPFAICAAAYSSLHKRGELASSTLNGDVESLAVEGVGMTDECGNPNPNAYGTLEAMQEVLWHFHSRQHDGQIGIWEPTFMFKPPVVPEMIKNIPSAAYYGWDYPGDGIVERLIHGSGHAVLHYGNAYNTTDSNVEILVNGLLKNTCDGGRLDCVYEWDFSNGDVLQIEENVRAVIVIIDLELCCGRSSCAAPTLAPTAPPTLPPTASPTPSPTAAPVLHEYVHISEAKWELINQENWDCDSACAMDVQELSFNGGAIETEARTLCATACLNFQIMDSNASLPCHGFLYTSPVDAFHTCYILAPAPMCLKDRRLTGGVGEVCYKKQFDKAEFQEYLLVDTGKGIESQPPMMNM